MPALQSRGRGGRSRRLVNEINVVPYIDVMLVLLVIFMVTAPLLPPGQIDLPTAGNSQKPGQRYIDARLEKGGRIRLATMNDGESKKTETTERDLVQQVKLLGASAEMPVVISADKGMPYGDVISLVHRLQQAGLRPALMVKPPS